MRLDIQIAQQCEWFRTLRMLSLRQIENVARLIVVVDATIRSREPNFGRQAFGLRLQPSLIIRDRVSELTGAQAPRPLVVSTSLALAQATERKWMKIRAQ